MCSRSTARRTLLGINFIFFLVGAVMVAMGSYALASADKLGQDLAPIAMLRLLISAGAIVATTSFMGCCGAAKNGRGCWRYVLLAYALIVLVVIVLQFVVVSFIFAWLHRLESVKGEEMHHGDEHGDEHGHGSNDMQDFEDSFNQAANRTYVACCVQKDDSKLCHWVDEHTSDGCAGNFTAFRDELVDAIEDRLRPLGIVAIVFGVIEVICLFTACGLFWKRPRDEEMDGVYSRHGTGYAARVA